MKNPRTGHAIAPASRRDYLERFSRRDASGRADYRRVPRAFGVDVDGVDLAAEVLRQRVHPQRVPPGSPLGGVSVAKTALEVERVGEHEGGQEPPVEVGEGVGREVRRPQLRGLDGPGADAASPVFRAGTRPLVVLARKARAPFTDDAPVHLGRLAEQGAHEEEDSDEEGQVPLH